MQKCRFQLTRLEMNLLLGVISFIDNRVLLHFPLGNPSFHLPIEVVRHTVYAFRWQMECFVESPVRD